MSEELKKEAENKLGLLNKTFKQSEIDLEVYETVEETEEETLEVMRCPNCDNLFAVELDEQDNKKDLVKCPGCEQQIERKEDEDDTK